MAISASPPSNPWAPIPPGARPSVPLTGRYLAILPQIIREVVPRLTKPRLVAPGDGRPHGFTEQLNGVPAGHRGYFPRQRQNCFMQDDFLPRLERPSMQRPSCTLQAFGAAAALRAAPARAPLRRRRRLVAISREYGVAAQPVNFGALRLDAFGCLGASCEAAMGSPGSQLTESFTNTGAALPAGSIVRPSGNNQGAAALASDVGGLLGVFQSNGSALPTNGRGTAITAGDASVLLEAGLAPAASDILYLSATVLGRATTVPPATQKVVGVITDASRYAVDGTVRAIVVMVGAGGGSSPADWSGVRFFFIDNDNGDDTNLGYIDAPALTTFTPAQTAPVALKTSEELRNRIPRTGAGRTVVALFKPRSDGGNYLDKSGASDYLDLGYIGYKYPAFRGSDLTNSTNDHADLGGVTAEVGPNVDGSWTVGGFAGFTVTIAAGTLAAEDTITGEKLEWKGNITAGLRPRGNTVNSRPSTSTFDLSTNTPGFVPAINDEFFIRRPGVKFTRHVGSPIIGQIPATSLGFAGVLTGFEFTATTVNVFAPGAIAQNFCRYAATVNQIGILTGNTYVSESLASFIAVFCGIDARALYVGSSYGAALTANQLARIANSAFHHSTACVFPNIGPGFAIVSTYFRVAPLIEFTASGRRLATGERGVIIGSDGVNTHRIRAVAGLSLRAFTGSVVGVDMDAAATGIVVTGEGNAISLDDIVGTVVGAVLNVSGALSSKVNVGGSITATGTPDISLVGFTKSFASLATDHWVDGGGNVVQGSGGNLVRRVTDGTVANAPVLAADPAAPVDGDFWIKDTGGVRTWNVRIGGVTYSAVLT